MVNVYKVHDEEWSQVMGSGQLQEFANLQLIEYINTNSDEEIDEDMKYHTEDIKHIVKYFVDNNELPHEITDEQAIELLQLRGFDVEKLNIY